MKAHQKSYKGTNLIHENERRTTEERFWKYHEQKQSSCEERSLYTVKRMNDYPAVTIAFLKRNPDIITNHVIINETSYVKTINTYTAVYLGQVGS